MRIPIKIIMRTPNNKGTKTKIFHNEEIAYIRAHFKKKKKKKNALLRSKLHLNGFSAAPWSKLPQEWVCSADSYPRVDFRETGEVCQ
jgi:hypothetical protein